MSSYVAAEIPVNICTYNSLNKIEMSSKHMQIITLFDKSQFYDCAPDALYFALLLNGYGKIVSSCESPFQHHHNTQHTAEK